MFGIEYIKIIGYGVIVFLFFFMIVIFFRFVGCFKVLFIVGVIGIIINMSLNMVLIYGFLGVLVMGVMGVVWVIVLFKVVELIVLIVIVFFYSNENYVREIFKKYLIIKCLVIMYILKGGLIIINEILWLIVMVFYVMFIISGIYEWVIVYGYL